MIFYCKAGELLKINAYYDSTYDTLFNKLHLEPFVWALDGKTKDSIRIPHEEIVLTLEASVPPFYEMDRIRCLWDEKEVFILRKVLKRI